MSNTHYIFLESLQNNYQAGGVVMLPILLAGVIGFYFLFSSWLRIGKDFFRADVHKVVKRMRRDLNGGERDRLNSKSSMGVEMAIKRLRKRGGLLGRELCNAVEIAAKNPDSFRDSFCLP